MSSKITLTTLDRVVLPIGAPDSFWRALDSATGGDGSTDAYSVKTIVVGPEHREAVSLSVGHWPYALKSILDVLDRTGEALVSREP